MPDTSRPLGHVRWARRVRCREAQEYDGLRRWSVRKICFVSEECNGLANAGGIGACVRGLASFLASKGWDVDILITNLGLGSDKFSGPAKPFVNNVFFLSDFIAREKSVEPPYDQPSKSYHVYRFLRRRTYDEVHFNDWLGSGFYTAMARRQGLIDAAIVTHLHGSSHWARIYNLNPPELSDLEAEGLERSQIENSDLVISPSRYLIDWYREQGLALPEVVQRQWILPQWNEPEFQQREGFLRTRGIEPGVVREIIYFGRHERRKGFDIFVDAIAKLPVSTQPDITFMGRFDRIECEYTGSMAIRKLRDYGGRLRFLNDLKQAEAMALLRRSPASLVVIPSRIENSPCVVGECFTLGIPFLTTDVGGTAELVSEESRAHCLVEPKAVALTQAITRVLQQGMAPLASTLSPSKILAQWDKRIEVSNVGRPKETPLVSVCFTHYERPDLLRRAYEAILAQTYENIEVIISDDGSRSASALAYLDEIEAKPARFQVTVIRGRNKYLGAARNAAAQLAKGKFLLFHDDDNYAEPNEIELFVQAALTYRADVLTAQYYVFNAEGGHDRLKPRRRIKYFPFGIGGIFSFFGNRFGDANALIRKSTFDELGGFTEEYGVGYEDWEFFLKAYLKNHRMGVVPEPLFNYRISTSGMLGSGKPMLDYERICRAIDEGRPSVDGDLVRYASRESIRRNVLDRTWDMLGKEPACGLHRELTTLEPNSPEAVSKLSDLTFELGRFADALEIGAKIFDQREKLGWLMRDRAVSRRSFELVIIEPSESEEAVFLEGWLVDAKGAPVDPARVCAAGRWFPVLKVGRMDRPDVRDALGLAEARGLGFMLYAMSLQMIPLPSPATGNASRAGRGLFGRSGAKLLQPLAIARRQVEGALQRKPFLIDDAFECNLPWSPGWRGHVDRGGWRRAVAIKIPEGYTETPNVEIETSAAADTALIWSDGQCDFGDKITNSRTQFTRNDGTVDKISVIVPCHIRAHVMVT